MPALPGYYTATEASKELGYRDTSYISSLCREGKIPAYKVGTIWLIPEDWVKNQPKTPESNRGNRGESRK